jgi:hypothetical protein
LRFQTNPHECGLDVIVLSHILAQDSKPWDTFDRKFLVDFRATKKEELMTHDGPTKPRLLDPHATEFSPCLRHRLSLLPLDIPGLQHGLEDQGLA